MAAAAARSRSPRRATRVVSSPGAPPGALPKASATPVERNRLLRARSRQASFPNEFKELAALGSIRSKGFLEARAVRPATKKYYSSILRDFQAHAAPLGSMNTDDELDAHLTEYCDYLFFEGYPGSMGTKLWAAVMDEMPRFSRFGSDRLPRFGRTLQAWGRLAPGQTRDPLPRLHMLAVVFTLVRWRLPHMALWVLLTFVGYFRPSETMLIRVKDIIAPTISVSHYSVQLHSLEAGRPSKVGVFNDGVSLDAPAPVWLGRTLQGLGLHLLPHDRLFQFEYSELKSKFEEACLRIGIQDPCMYRLRHGGASHDRATNSRTLDAIKKRGRWACDASLRRYEKAVRLQEVEAQVPPVILQWCSVQFPALEQYIRSPLSLPPLPWL